MKTLKTAIFGILLGLLSVFFIPHGVFAADDSDLVKTQNGSQCLDLEAAYAEINNSSKALTNNDNGVDAMKKANTLATLTNITSFLLGDSMFCVKDEVAASKVTDSKQYGLLGELGLANGQMMASFPTVNVGSHLAEMFVPGYGNNSSTFAYSENCQTEYTAYLTCVKNNGCQDVTPLPDSCLTACSAEISTETACLTANGGGVITDGNGVVIDSGGAVTPTGNGEYSDAASATAGGQSFIDGLRGIITNTDITDLQNDVNNIDSPTGSEITSPGLSYLQDSIHLDKIWNWSRNIAYLGYVIIAIVIGFMIMFRKNLGGQTVVSIGNAIPNLVIGILLVTFSFAIVGLMLDIGKIGINVAQNMFTTIGKESGEDELASGTVIKTDNVGELFNGVFLASTNQGKSAVATITAIPIVGPILSKIIGSNFFAANIEGKAANAFEKLGAVFKKLTVVSSDAEVMKAEDIQADIPFGELAITALETALDMFLQSVKYGLIMAMAKLVLIALVCLFAAIKLFITIITTYFKIFINVILAPIQILVGSLPGNSGMIASWFKSVVANVLVFVGIVFVVNFFNYIAVVVDPEQFNFFGNSGVIWPNWLIPLKGVIVIAGYFFASSLPGVINGLLKVEQSREMTTAGMDIKKAASKIPLIGGIFNS